MFKANSLLKLQTCIIHARVIDMNVRDIELDIADLYPMSSLNIVTIKIKNLRCEKMGNDSIFMGASTKQGYDIASKSREIVRSLIADKIKDLSPAEQRIVERIVHSTADPEYADISRVSSDFVDESIKAIKARKDILTDINMVKVGINKYEGEIKCYISHEDAIKLAKEEQITRAAAAMRVAHEEGFDGIIVIGNAPTALFEAINLVENEDMKAKAIAGVPVGFVGAAESKEALTKTKIPHIITKGPKGGTPVAVAIANSLIGLEKLV